MTLHDLYLLSPELSLAAMALALILVDLVLDRKALLPALAVAGLVVPLAFTLTLIADVSASGETQGIFGTLAVDRFSLFFKLLFLGIVSLVILASVDYVSHFKRFQGEYYALVLLSAVGMMLLASTTELITLYISLELTALPLAALAAFRRDATSGEAAIKFLLLSAISSALLLYGMALTYGFTGTTHLPQIARSVASGYSSEVPFGSYALLLGTVLMVAGFGFKIASVPFQMWVPDVYQGAPTPITAYLSVASKSAGFALILRVFYIAFPTFSIDWGILFAALSVASMTIGNLVAIAQNNIKRMLAYSTVAHAGYLLMGLAAIAAHSPSGQTLGPGGVLFYLGAYSFTNLAAFFAIIAISNQVQSDSIKEYAGVARRAPWLALVLALALVSLTGIPPTAGFIAKVYIFNTAVQSNLVWLALAGVINSVLSAYYYLRVVRVMYLAQPTSEEKVPSSLAMRAALLVTAVGVITLGILPAPLLDIAQRSAATLLHP